MRSLPDQATVGKVTNLHELSCTLATFLPGPDSLAERIESWVLK